MTKGPASAARLLDDSRHVFFREILATPSRRRLRLARRGGRVHARGASVQRRDTSSRNCTEGYALHAARIAPCSFHRSSSSSSCVLQETVNLVFENQTPKLYTSAVTLQ
ncbi:hypothetical protein SKAU_G00401640 [Synaphobranchus kaupii]|uniref:Uncharacterized protein n=1 Tax=Synaphobranchus kaupii TaxID=118154 RepID=A0A9Q1E942_SYNKA|nr:hypothetical protein SKAU_G00401640 [Synaphobranchus kaupii]